MIRKNRNSLALEGEIKSIRKLNTDKLLQVDQKVTQTHLLVYNKIKLTVYNKDLVSKIP